MKQFALLLILPFVLFLACETVPTHSEMEFLLELLEADDLISLTPPPEEAPPEEPPSEAPPPAVTPVTTPPATIPRPEEPVLAAQPFDPNNVSEDLYETTKTNIQELIQRLDAIIRARNYNAWIEYLSDSYLEVISAPEFLDERAEELYRRDQLVAAALGRNPRTVEKKALTTLRDYFDNVVVPSRTDDRVDDIAFITETKVRAYTVNNRGVRLILYDLEMVGGTWKIIG